MVKGLLSVWRWARPIRLGWNMLCCAVLFAPFGVLPRETISGFIGRQSANGKRWARYGERFIDWLHPHEPKHCAETAFVEASARVVLYPELYR